MTLNKFISVLSLFLVFAKFLYKKKTVLEGGLQILGKAFLKSLISPQ